MTRLLTDRLKRRLLTLALAVPFAVLGLLLFAWTGLYNVAATSEHLPATETLLRFAMESSVRTRSLGVAAPPLADPAKVERGAGHFETGCAPCHGAPGDPGSRVAAAMLPPPPPLSGAVGRWTDAELFWLVKHGLKYTGMPGWAAPERDDEVWSMVAFLKRLPHMQRAEYDSLAMGPLAGESPPEMPGELFSIAEGALIGSCARCHRGDGAGSPSGAFPRLDIHSSAYLRRALRDYAGGLRPSGIMQTVAADLDGAQMDRLAEYFAARSGTVTRPKAEQAGDAELGSRIAALGVPERQVPPCSVCHGLAGGPENPQFPTLAGQYAGYLGQQLRLFRSGVRGDGSYARIMQAVARNMTDAEIDAAAAFYAGLSAAGTTAAGAGLLQTKE